MTNSKSQWTILTMEEIQDYVYVESKTFPKISFPTKRWGKTYTKTSTDNKVFIDAVLVKYKEKGFTVRKRIDYETMKKFHPSYGKFYQLQIKKTSHE